MKLILIFLLFGVFLVNAQDNLNQPIPEYSKLRTKYGNQTINRPLYHFTPSYGWMNDPNGCWYDQVAKLYHIYYQYNPADTIWGMPLYWGHATSQDLINWEQHGIAIRPKDWGGAYSGSMFIDDENISGWFQETSGETKYQNAIAAWTWNAANWSEFQCLSHSTNAGYDFVTYNENCPAINEDSQQHRDPQVVKYGKGQYVMSVAKSHEYSIYFYKSTDAKNWAHFGSFTLYGYLGFQYECPNLIHLKNNDKKTDEEKSYWILFISINPGSQQGGSSTEYFIGQFDYSEEGGQPFKLNFNYNTLIDVGKDFYAMQIMYFPPSDDELENGFDKGIGITWTSNWQYSKVVPTDPWRSSMAIPREIKLGHYQPASDSTPIIYVLSKALLDNDDNSTAADTTTRFDTDLPAFVDVTGSGFRYTPAGNPFGALELYVSFDSCDAYSDHDPGQLSFYLRGGSIPEEYLRFGFNQKADAFFLDRGNTNVQWVHDNPFFTDKLSMNVYGTSTDRTQTGTYKSSFTYNDDGTFKYETSEEGSCSVSTFSAHLIIDRNIIEIFFNEDENGYSAITSTNTFFFTGGNFIENVDVVYNSFNGHGFENIKIRGRNLNLKTTTTESGRRLNEKITDL